MVVTSIFSIESQLETFGSTTENPAIPNGPVLAKRAHGVDGGEGPEGCLYRVKMSGMKLYTYQVMWGLLKINEILGSRNSTTSMECQPRVFITAHMVEYIETYQT